MTDSPSRSPCKSYGVERASTSVAPGTDVIDEKDPMFLKEKIISKEDIKDLKQRRKGNKLAKFYTVQNFRIDDLLKPMRAHTSDASQEKANTALRVRIAIHASFIVNCCLAVLQLYAAISSSSLALFASYVDAECIREFATHKGDDLEKFHLASLVSVGVAFVAKLCLFLYCFAVRKSSSHVEVLWEDHRNDLCTNAFGILTSAGGAELKWWIDPMGATILGVLVLASWTGTAHRNLAHLACISAPSEFINFITYKALTFSPFITGVDNVRACHCGPEYFVEINVVLPPNIPLWEAHGITQPLQDAIEELKDVDRCFVHGEFEASNDEHRKN
ncbi:cation diffusion facilitator [Cryptococcus neoformans C23]|uniref:Cation diffusion facilitator n=1 Tax=Cryptococcus neoformans (strain H99 / ATCC 208821 / CBS 10515 / FGSC 9487) TaxID=235443 RepID=J9VS27_CRYN9|nr:cation diffusion facilitator [Cryptococcus neoformans var. grubii H99]AUB27047.1 cation diffusion facilitator [Cryptococcus neoformans var. grubii]OWZ29375.1 cation diffusion facilitator [Cryptococcus neoformans var. grubii AD2-60a]OWZ35914.1 cation diffusion facilitator [Cryptococcus neoformans var. grubii AD1-83a]OWZ41240.1 cation diffusion facilitator [Cryptococcus neoformans var. grubii C23]OXC82941.1 cation diffusion facilitator [Cryptococcus neoformans var. grubii AD1-7a]OXG53440.1 c|eukprot:XP_012051500.1 cation diffusion facilitator [Cryptococcus neoformans var. grubii H99]